MFVDNDNDNDNYGKYILTGSSQFNMIKGIIETSAGSIGLLSLLLFQYTETPERNRYESIYKDLLLSDIS